MSDSYEEGNTRRNKKSEQQRLLERPSDREGHRSRSGSRHAKRSSSQKDAAEKLQREKVHLNRSAYKTEVRLQKAKAFNERKAALARLGLFAIAAIHKMDHPIVASSLVTIRESLLLLFLHHLIMQGEVFKRLLSGNLCDKDATVKAIPLLVNSSMRQDSLRSNATASPGISRPGPSAMLDGDGPCQQLEGSSSKSLATYLKWSARAFASSVRISPDDSSFVRLSRSLEYHVDRLVNPYEIESVRKGNSKKKRAWKYATYYGSKRKLYPLLFNPQPVKRYLTTFTQRAETIIGQICSSMLENNRRRRNTQQTTGDSTPSVFVATSSDSNEQAKEGTIGSRPSLNTVKGLVSRKFEESSKGLSALASSVSVAWHEKSLLDPSVSIEEMDLLSHRVCAYLDEKLDGSSSQIHTSLTDLAERVAHLPPCLCTALMKAVEPVDAVIPPVDEEIPLSVLSEPCSAKSAGYVEAYTALSGTIPEMILTPPVVTGRETRLTDNIPSACSLPANGKGLSPWSCSEAELDPSIDRQKMVEHDRIASAASPVDAATLFKYVPLPLILFWEVVYNLLKSGSWDCTLEETLKQMAFSLDIPNDLFDLIVAYAADLIAESVAESLRQKETEIGFDHNGTPSEVSSDAPSPGNKSLATTNSKSLKVHSAFPRAKILRIAGMALGVGALSALTAGLAAPAFAAGFGALGIAGTSGIATFLGSAGGAASLASLFGASSASLSGWKYSRRLADIRIFEFVQLSCNCVMDAIASFVGDVMDHHSRPNLLGMSHVFPHPGGPMVSQKLRPPFRIVIGISGWLRSIEDATKPWHFLKDRIGTELFALKWEPHLLTELGTMMIRIVGENVAYSAASMSVQMTMAASAGLIMWPVSLLQYAGQLDNTWMTCRERAQQAGYLLASALCDTSLVGHRPVTLIGYSVGSRVISYCLRELYDRAEYHRVQDVIVMGLPGSKVREVWRKMRSVVSGRLINVYCTTDWILALLYRWMEWGVQVAGLSAVEDVPGVENFDATSIVVSHNNYEKRIPEILSILNFHTTLLSKEDLLLLSNDEGPPSRTSPPESSILTNDHAGAEKM